MCIILFECAHCYCCYSAYTGCPAKHCAKHHNLVMDLGFLIRLLLRKNRLFESFFSIKNLSKKKIMKRNFFKAVSSKITVAKYIKYRNKLSYTLYIYLAFLSNSKRSKLFCVSIFYLCFVIIFFFSACYFASTDSRPPPNLFVDERITFLSFLQFTRLVRANFFDL